MALTNVMKMLDINNAVRNPLDLLRLFQAGLFAKTIEILERSLSLGNKDMARLLSVSTRTIDRYKVDSNKILSPAISERIVKIAMVKDKCEEVFEDSRAAMEWLKSESVALGGRTPLEIMEFDLGIDLVTKELIRIEHGIVS